MVHTFITNPLVPAVDAFEAIVKGNYWQISVMFEIPVDS